MTEQFMVNVADAGEISPDDILFECGSCGKSLVIDRRGAGLTIRCPDCNAELQVPIPEGVDLAEIDQSISAGLEPATVDTGDVLNPDDLPVTLREKAQNLITELQELRFRRGFLERKYAQNRQGIQAISRQTAAIRAALDEIDEVLRGLAGPDAGDTQTVG